MPEHTIIAAIPARYGSSRLPGKPLAEIDGRPMIEHVYRRASRVSGLARVVVLTDDERVGAAVEGFGGEWQMTPGECRSGSDRIAWAARDWDAAAIVNVQGDEPLVDPAAIERVTEHLRRHPADPIVTLATPAAAADLDDPHAVKVVVDRRGYALYFSRAAIPHPRRPGAAPAWKHLGIYGYRRRALLELAGLEPSPLELCEALEQLRALENGIPIRVLTTAAAEPGVDTPGDLERVRSLIQKRTSDHREERSP